MMPDWLADGLVGVAGGLIFAFTKLRGDLCEGEELPTRREKQAAWAQFANFMWTAPVFAATLTPAIMRKIGHGPESWVTWPMVAAFVGAGANFFWPLMTAVFKEETAAYAKRIWKAIRGLLAAAAGAGE